MPGIFEAALTCSVLHEVIEFDTAPSGGRMQPSHLDDGTPRRHAGAPAADVQLAEAGRAHEPLVATLRGRDRAARRILVGPPYRRRHVTDAVQTLPVEVWRGVTTFR
jgi:hypothetical protein